MQDNDLAARCDALVHRLRNEGRLLKPADMGREARPMAAKLIQLLEAETVCTAVHTRWIRTPLRDRAFRLATRARNGRGARLAHDIALFLEDVYARDESGRLGSSFSRAASKKPIVELPFEL